MKKNLLNISNVVLIAFVLFLSMGVNVSKMKCDKNSAIYIGTDVPSCIKYKEITCSDSDKKKTSCCMIKNQKSCCPETMDDSCASSTKNIHFNFETLISSFVIDFGEKCNLVYVCLFYEESYYLKHKFISLTKLPLPPNLLKPKLVEIQSFLL